MLNKTGQTKGLRQHVETFSTQNNPVCPERKGPVSLNKQETQILKCKNRTTRDFSFPDEILCFCVLILRIRTTMVCLDNN